MSNVNLNVSSLSMIASRTMLNVKVSEVLVGLNLKLPDVASKSLSLALPMYSGSPWDISLLSKVVAS